MTTKTPKKPFFEVRKTEQDSILFHSLFHRDDAGGLQYEKASRFADLKENAIISAFDKLLDEIYDL